MRTIVSLALLSLACLGCTPSGPKTHKITGKLTFRAEPVKEASLTFENPSSGFADQAKVKEGGAYEITLTDGTYKVAVEPPANSTSPPDYSYKKVTDVPKKYWSSSESGLSYTISGPGEINIDMK
jgi:hypothetical protein